MDETASQSAAPATAGASEANGPEAAEAAFNRLRTAWRAEGGLPYKARMRLLKGLIKALHSHADRLAAALQADYGARAPFESLVGEVFMVREGAKDARAHLYDWMEPEEVDVSIHVKPAKAKIVSQPLGVVGIITPWNYPVQLALAPLVGAIAAGNRVLIKTSEYTPHANEAIAALVAEVFPADVVAMVSGGSDTGAAVAGLPLDHLLFTGSTRVGHLVMEAAAKNLTPVTLELGGKSPAIIHESFSLTKAAERIVWGKMFNSGQTCIAPDYVLVPKGQGSAFADAAKAAYERMYPSMKENPDHTALIHERHFRRVASLVHEAEQAGVTVVRAGSEEPDPETRKMPLHLLMEPASDLRIMQEEIFGPLLPVFEYDSIADAIDTVNGRPRPLALYYFDRRGKRIDHMLARTVSGGVTVNDCMLHITQHGLPFGGVGPSGLGAYHGHHGFRTFSHRKSVLLQARVNALSLLNPPYGGLARWFAKLVNFL